MEKIKIAFDIDGTLLTFDNKPNYPIIELLHKFCLLNCDIFVWSGGGVDYARSIVNRLGLENKVKVIPKSSEQKVDICIDDQEVALAKVNLKIK